MQNKIHILESLIQKQAFCIIAREALEIAAKENMGNEYYCYFLYRIRDLTERIRLNSESISFLQKAA